MSRSRNGRCSQRRSNLPPIGVAQRSRMPSSVCSWRPLRLCSSSKLRRLAASRITLSSWRSTRNPVRCGRAPRWVFLTYCSKHPAAATATGWSIQPKPSRSCTRNWAHSARVALARSKCQDACRRKPGCWRHPSGGSDSSLISNSAGFSRSSSLRSAVSSCSCATTNRPLLKSKWASPWMFLTRCRATNRLSRRSSSSASSVKVPGVTIRTTCRSTGPLLVAGSPSCSQMATDKPSFTSLAR